MTYLWPRERPALAGASTWRCIWPSPTDVLHRLTGWAIERGEALDGLSVDRPSLEDVYLSLTSEEAHFKKKKKLT